jgi:hypothetical protein
LVVQRSHCRFRLRFWALERPGAILRYVWEVVNTRP